MANFMRLEGSATRDATEMFNKGSVMSTVANIPEASIAVIVQGIYVELSDIQSGDVSGLMIMDMERLNSEPSKQHSSCSR
jgi:hypothetical protein